MLFCFVILLRQRERCRKRNVEFLTSENAQLTPHLRDAKPRANFESYKTSCANAQITQQSEATIQYWADRKLKETF